MSWIQKIFGKKNKLEIDKINSIQKIDSIQSDSSRNAISTSSKIKYIKLNTNWNAEPVSPEINLKIDGDDLIMDIYLNHYAFDNFKTGDKAKIRFKNCTLYSLNKCNDEGYYYGQYRTNPSELPWGEFYEIVSGLDRNMPNPTVKITNNSSDKKHFLFFFKDETFECVASGFELNFYNINDGELSEIKNYKIVLDGEEIGTTKLEKADAPMGVVYGNIIFNEIESPYRFFKEYCLKNNILVNIDDPVFEFINTQMITELKVFREDGLEIRGFAGNAITGMESEGYEISILGISYPFYEQEFPHHVKEYENRFNKE